MVLSAPISGRLVAIKDVPDPVFSEKMLGDGFAVEDTQSKKVVITACVSGILKNINVNRHAFIIETPEGIEVLTHIGIDTVSLKGKGLKVLSKIGRRVSVGDKIIKADLEFLRGNAPSAMVIIVISNRPNIALTISKVGEVSVKDVICEIDVNLVENSVSTEEQVSSGNEELGDWVTVANPHGIHARPAAVLAKQASTYSSQIFFEKEGGIKVDAKSSTSIMSLGLNCGDRARVCSNDIQAIEKLSNAVKSGLGEQVANSSSASLEKSTNVAPNLKKSKPIFNIDFGRESCLQLPVASPGVSCGQIVVVKEIERSISERGGSSSEEKSKLEIALKKAVEDINNETKKVDDSSVEILEAHKAFIMDPELKRLSFAEIDTGKSCGYAWNKVTKEKAKVFVESGNTYMAERAADMRDVNNRVLDVLMGKIAGPSYKENSIVVMHELTPSDVTNFSSDVKGVVTVMGSPTSHASIMLRNRGVPALYQVPEEILDIRAEGVFCVIDTNKGEFLINPKLEERENYVKTIHDIKVQKEKALLEAKKKGETQDGHRIEVTGNVSSVKEAKEATERGAEGYGLARSEFLFYGRHSAPTEEEQGVVYQGLLDATEHMVTVRLLDAGGDKPLPYVRINKEANPQLGIRGMRIIDDNEEIYRTQIRALLRCKGLDRLRIMTPMISMVSEVHKVRLMIVEEGESLGISKLPQIGIMAETPAVCVMSEQFAPHVDFFSVGTNDLTQYTMAMDRENSILAPLASAMNPAVLFMIHCLCQGANKFGKPVAVCGGAASDPIMGLLFVGLGVRELASSGETLPEVKAAIRKYTLKHLEEVAKRVLLVDSESKVREIVKKEF